MSKCQEHVVQRVCVPGLCLYVYICAHECLSLHLWACMCRSFVFYAASIRLDADPSPSLCFWGWEEFTCAMFLILSSSFFSPAVIFPAPSLQETIPLDCQSGLATIISSSAAPAFSPFIYPPFPLFHLTRAASVRCTSTDGAWEKLAVRHIPLLPSLCLHLSCSLPYSALSSPSLLRLLPSSPLHITFLCPPLLSLATSPSLPRCSPYPLYFHPSAPPSFPTPPSFFCFIICNMI